MFKFGRMVWGLPLVMSLAGCIGGSGSDGGIVGGGTADTSVASVAMIADSPQIGTAPAAETDITAIVKDGSNRAVDGQTVSFTASSGLLVIEQGTTDGSGKAIATLSPGSDASNRDITVTATAGTITASYTVKVIGSTVGVTGPSSVIFNDPVTLSIRLRDSAGNAVPATQVSLSSANGNQISPATVTTSADGNATATFTGVSGGLDVITATALGSSDTHSISVSNDAFSITVEPEVNINTCTAVDVSWETNGAAVASTNVGFSATRGTLYTDDACTVAGNTATTDGDGAATMYLMSPNSGTSTVTATGANNGPTASASTEFVATTPDSMVLQASRTKLNLNDSVTLTATVRDADFNLVKGTTVQFSITTDTTGGSLGAASGVTDSLGRVSTTYNSTSQPSSLDGVTIVASIPDTGISQQIKLTVGDSSASINLGMATKIESPNDATYRYTGAVQVSDSAGNPVRDARVTLKLDAESYDKGYLSLDGFWSTVSEMTTFAVFVTTPGQLSCPNEDSSEDGYRNNIIDEGEDANGNGTLEPGIPATVTSLVTTDEFGNAAFDVVYPKDYAHWVQVRIDATAEVAGTESTNAIRFVLPMSQEDEDSPPGTTSPFGTAASCNDPN